MNAVGALQQFDFGPNLPLTPGSQYVAFLSIANLPDQPESNAFDLTPTPEPTPLLLWGTAMAGFGLARRRRSRESQ